ncbi:MAG: V-type ATP synthase subunit E [Lachnospiraceae bacterium]|nr:V-type ATP synthase subunit E [Lachnospiraceae bacterium]
MTGTEKILRHIADKAGGEAAAIMEKAREEAARLEEKARAEREEILADAEKQGRDIVDAARERSEVTAAAYKRRTLLATRGALVKEALDKAWENILALPDQEYFDFLYTQLDKQDLGRDGQLCLNAKDLERRPADFEEKIAAAAARQKGTLVLGGFPADIAGGFILQYGGVEENCSLEAIFESEADVLKDAVRAVLFED